MSRRVCQRFFSCFVMMCAVLGEINAQYAGHYAAEVREREQQADARKLLYAHVPVKLPRSPVQERSAADAYLEKGLEHYNAGRYKEAVEAYKEAVGLAPENANAHYGLGRAYYALERWSEAEAAYRETLRFKPDSANAHVSLGMTFHRQGRLKEAIASYKEAVRIKPDMAETRWNLGLSHHSAKQYREAIAAYREYARLKPSAASEFQYQHNFGDALRGMGQNAQAIEAFKRAVIIKHDNSESHYGLGMAHLASRQFEDAVKALIRATVIKPGFVPYELALGRAYFSLGNLESARKQYKILKTLDPKAANEFLNEIDGK